MSARRQPPPAAMTFLEPVPHTPIVRTDDYREVPGLEALVNEGADRVRLSTDLGVSLATAGRSICETMLNMRLKVRSPHGPFPDLRGDSAAIKEAAYEVYARAAVRLGAEDRQRSHQRIKRAVQNQMTNVLVPFLRELSSNPETAWRYFPEAAKYDPEDATEAVYALYAAYGIDLPRKSRNEEQAEKRMLERKGPPPTAPLAELFTHDLSTLEKLEKSYALAAARAAQYDEEKRLALKARMLSTAGTLASEAAKL